MSATANAPGNDPATGMSGLTWREQVRGARYGEVLLVMGRLNQIEATVYNTLNLFVQKKLIREVIVDPNRVFYDPNTAAHYHMYDVETGRLTDIDGTEVRIEGLPDLPAGLVTEGMDIIIRVRRADGD